MGSSEKEHRSETTRFNFTVKAISALESRESRYNVFDSNTRGLGITIHPTGQKTFFHLKKVMGMPERRVIGIFPDFAVEQARGKAAEINSKLATWKSNEYEGANPLEKPKKAPTLGEVLEHYIEHHLRATVKNPDVTIKDYRKRFDNHLAVFRNRPLGTIRRERVRELHAKITAEHGAVTANRTITSLRTLFYHAVHPDIDIWQGANPAAKPKKFLNAETSRERIIGRDEAPRFFAALADEPHRDLRDFLLLALATGARRGTIFAMKWEQIDFDHAMWVIPNPKGKKGRAAHPLPLTQLAVSVLKARERKNDWVFPGRKTHITTVKKPWTLFLKRAEIQGLTLHDLRRTLASKEGETGASTEVIQKTLGHEESSEATKIYDRSDRRDAVRDAMSAAMAAMLKAGKTTKRKLLTAASRG
jgi:integrase